MYVDIGSFQSQNAQRFTMVGILLEICEYAYPGNYKYICPKLRDAFTTQGLKSPNIYESLACKQGRFKSTPQRTLQQQDE